MFKSQNPFIVVPNAEEVSPEYKKHLALGRRLKAQKSEAKTEALRLRSLLSGDDNQQDSRIALIAVGEEASEPVDYQAQYRAAVRRYSDLEAACEIHDKNTRTIRLAAATDVCAKVKPEHDAATKRLAAALVEAHEANRVLFQLRTDLRAQDLAFVNILDVAPHEVLGAPNDKYSPFADLMRELVARGYLSKLPESLR